jgi:NTP pyrophosphatase (non-canonical NTP hydrolase)
MSETLAVLADRTQQVSDIYAARMGIDRNDDWYALKLQEELGELIAEHLRLTGRGRVKEQTAEAIRAARDDEAADLLASVLLYCRHYGIDVEAALARKWFRHLEPSA